MKKTKTQFYYGLSGIELPVPKYKFPPPYQEASRLTYYASLFNSLEINSSFYKIPMGRTIARWADSVPEDFKFTFKLFRELTHNKCLAFKDSDVKTFFHAIDHAGNKKGCVLVQLPPGTGCECSPVLQRLMECVSDHNSDSSWKIAVEFRHRSWYCPEIFYMLDSFKAALVIHDIPKSSTPLISHTSEFMYVRFHGPTGNYRGTYDESFLCEYAGYIREWLDEGKLVYTYFNNTVGDAYANQRTLARFIHNHA